VEVIRNNTLAVRIKFLLILIILLFFAVAGRLYIVQIERHDELFNKAREQYTSTRKTSGKRGEIYDFSGNLLVGNIPCSTIEADPYACGSDEQCRQISLILGKYLNIPPEKIYSDLIKKTRERKRSDGTIEKVPRRYALIARDVPLPKSEMLKKMLREQNLIRGIYFQEHSQRFYPKNELLANILGFTSIERDQLIAQLGIEKFFNKVISPSDNVYRYEHSRDGIPLAIQRRQEVNDGVNIYLTIQEPIQAILEEELDKLMAQWQPQAAYAIMVDPRNGNIMAIAQRPTFNPNDRSTMTADAYRMRFISDTLEPGSTMKPISISGAIDKHIVTPQTMIDCEKGIWFYCGKSLSDTSPHGMMNVAGIVQKSSNIGTAKIALMMGPQLLYDTLRAFGFGQRTGIPLQPETIGRLVSLKHWDGLSITRFPMGYGISCSPVQLARAYCALANGGRLVSLRLVDRIENPDTGITVKYPVREAPKIYRDPATHRKIIEMMKLVTRQGGTARQAAIPGYEVAGKTGTSRKWEGKHYSNTRYFASFAGFAPADNPEFVLVVIADEPQKRHYGGVVAGPTFKNIAERTLRYLNIKPTVPHMPSNATREKR
jgi:cell division protein FtsI/penicillin-binding protein 2